MLRNWLARRGSRLTLGASGLAVMAMLLTAPAPASAGELYGENFCANVTLGHLGGLNDSCVGAWHFNKVVRGFSEQHSTCVSTTTNGTKSGVNVSWACSSGGGYLVYNSVNQNAWTQAIIRNNTTGDSEVVVGGQYWCDPGPPC